MAGSAFELLADHVDWLLGAEARRRPTACDRSSRGPRPSPFDWPAVGHSTPRRPSPRSRGRGRMAWTGSVACCSRWILSTTGRWPAARRGAAKGPSDRPACGGIQRASRARRPPRLEPTGVTSTARTGGSGASSCLRRSRPAAPGARARRDRDRRGGVPQRPARARVRVDVGRACGAAGRATRRQRARDRLPCAGAAAGPAPAAQRSVANSGRQRRQPALVPDHVLGPLSGLCSGPGPRRAWRPVRLLRADRPRRR